MNGEIAKLKGEGMSDQTVAIRKALRMSAPFGDDCSMFGLVPPASVFLEVRRALGLAVAELEAVKAREEAAGVIIAHVPFAARENAALRQLAQEWLSAPAPAGGGGGGDPGKSGRD